MDDATRKFLEKEANLPFSKADEVLRDELIKAEKRGYKNGFQQGRAALAREVYDKMMNLGASGSRASILELLENYMLIEEQS